MPLKTFPAHSIIKINGRWGVLCVHFGRDIKLHKQRVVDFWDGGREIVDNNALAEGLPPDGYPG